MFKNIYAKIMCAVTILGVSLMPLAASAALTTGTFFPNPNQVLPSVTQTMTFTITSDDDVDAFYISTPSCTSITFVAGSVDHGGVLSVGNTRVDFGSFSSKLTDFASSFVFHAQVTTGATVATCNWTSHLFHWTGATLDADITLTAGVSQKVTTDPHPTIPNAIAPVSGPTATGLTDSGLGDYSGLGTVEGLLEPGPIDSILNLPLTLLGQLIDVASGVTIDYPTIIIAGYSQDLDGGGEMYDGIGSTATGVIAGASILLLLWGWVQSLYHRLQRATDFNTHSGDTWGPL